MGGISRRRFLKLLAIAGAVASLGTLAYVLSPPRRQLPEAGSEEGVAEKTGGESLEPIAVVEVVAEDLEVPWSIAPLGDGSFFVSERPGRLVYVDARGSKKLAYTASVASVGEAGFLGIALHPEFPSKPYLYGYLSYFRGSDVYNRVVRLRVDRHSMKIIASEAIVDGIPGGIIHNGGRIRFGPDGALYITTGDAARPRLAQDLGSLEGKILRVDEDGGLPPDNPFPGSPVYSYGHRNPQGLDWHPSKGFLVATEHGPTGRDEVNVVAPGGNYGWPDTVGKAGAEGFIDPIVESGRETWAPSGASFVRGGQFRGLEGDLLIACLRGQMILRVKILSSSEGVVAEKAFEGRFGRLRDIVFDRDGSILVATSNKDGRGTPRGRDDKVLRLSRVE